MNQPTVRNVLYLNEYPRTSPNKKSNQRPQATLIFPMNPDIYQWAWEGTIRVLDSSLGDHLLLILGARCPWVSVCKGNV